VTLTANNATVGATGKNDVLALAGLTACQFQRGEYRTPLTTSAATVVSITGAMQR
jgi:hypothetical protein